LPSDFFPSWPPADSRLYVAFSDMQVWWNQTLQKFLGEWLADPFFQMVIEISFTCAKFCNLQKKNARNYEFRTFLLELGSGFLFISLFIYLGCVWDCCRLSFSWKSLEEVKWRKHWWSLRQSGMLPSLS
jgi:hypothetical protein